MKNELPNTSNLYFWIKDNNLNYLDCNEKFAEMGGADSPTQIKGKSDFQMCWSESANFFRANDAKVLMGSNYINPCEEVRNAESGVIKMVTVKVPYYSSEGKCLGVIGTGICISPKYLKEKNTTSNIKNGIFQLGEEFHNKYLTKRELDVLKSVLLRHTSKIIARILKISPRTVECYIAILKDKLQCSSKAEIISKAVTMKMYYLIHEIF